MTHDELNALSDGDIDRLIAERVMKWKANHIDQPPTHHSFYWWDAAGLEPVTTKDKWRPTSDHNDCAAMRAEIERRGLQMLFVLFMQRVFDASGNLESNWWVKPWFILNSKPRQQCIAALLAMGKNRE